MVLIYYKDILPILISSGVFSLLATAHRVLIPSKYSAFLQFKQEENINRTAQSTAVRIVYLILGTCMLNIVFKLSEKQIALGVFIACFLNVWPAIIQNQLMKLRKTTTEWLLLIGYITFIIMSCLIVIITIRLFIPILGGDTSLYWLENQAISLLFTLLAMILPIPVEVILARFTYIVIVQKIDAFIEEVYILENQLNMESERIKKNKFVIDSVAKEADINTIFLESILKLELIYRGRLYYYVLEKILCKCFGGIAIKKDISVGIAQIKISTAQRLLRRNPDSFIKKICNDEFNIFLCGKLLKSLIIQYNEMVDQERTFELENYVDIYDYIACEYLGAWPTEKNKTVLLYSAVLRSVMKDKLLCYTGSAESGNCIITIKKDDKKKIPYDKYQELKEYLKGWSTIKKEVYIDGKIIELEVVCKEPYCIEKIRRFARQYNCEVSMY